MEAFTPSCKFVEVLPLYRYGPEEFQVGFENIMERKDYNDHFPMIPSMKQDWYNDGLTPNSLGFIAFHFAVSEMIELLNGNPPPDVKQSFEYLMNYLSAYNVEVLDLRFTLDMHERLLQCVRYFVESSLIRGDCPEFTTPISDTWSIHRRQPPFRPYENREILYKFSGDDARNIYRPPSDAQALGAGAQTSYSMPSAPFHFDHYYHIPDAIREELHREAPYRKPPKILKYQSPPFFVW